MLLLLGLLILFTLDLTVGQVGVCYGTLGNNLPSPSEVVAICKQNNIKRMRIYYPDASTLQALSGSNIEVMLGAPTTELEYLAASQTNANAWVENNIQGYPAVRFRYIALGNEVSPTGNTSRFVLAALKNVYSAISTAGLGNQIRVSTVVEPLSLVGNSFPPASAKFRSDVTSYLNPIIRFLVNTTAPLFVNLYPFVSCISNPIEIDIRYALLQPKSVSVLMPSETMYDNLFNAILDAIYAALERSGGSSVEIVVSETGWPSAGGGNSTMVENARIYNTNLIQILKNGTPKRPGRPIEAYIFGMFDENMKNVDQEYDRHFGVFLPNGQPKYQIIFGTLHSMRISTSTICLFVA